MNGRSRAVRIPSDFELEGDEVIIRQEHNGLITIEPVEKKMTPREVIAWLRAQPPLPEEEWLPEIEDLPPRDVDL
ncbi:antitoxin [Martelella lutilitoris]|nr:AbrB/MazE/SpoVT family DNA-binding domain-containing protein [Martelella lutilitoris]